MFSASEMNQALVKAFNISVCYNNIINTNLKVQNVHQGLRNKDYIVISFDKSMNADQCIEYLNNMKERIVKTFCGSESGANMSFNIKFFPFNFSKEQLIKDGKERYKFSVPMDKDVIFNLKCLLAYGFAKDAKEDMGSEFGERCMEGRVYDVSFDRKSYLYCMRFYDKRLQEYFIESFSATVKGYKNSPKRTDDFLKVKDNCVYIKKSLFDKTKFINEIEESQACLIGRDLQTSSSNDPAVEKIKYLITGFIRKACPPLYYVFHTSYSGNNEDSILVPIVSYGNYYRFLTKEEVDTINSIFGMVVLNNIESYTSPKHLPVFGSRGIYGIDFSNKEISHCVITQIIENSVINKDHELSIDPELRFQALSPPSTPVHNGYPIQNGSISGFNGYLSSDEEAGPSSKMSQAQVRSPTRKDQGGTLKESPRQGFIGAHSALLVSKQVDVLGTSGGSLPSSKLGSIAVSYDVAGPSSSQSVNAAEYVPARTSANSSSSQGTFTLLSGSSSSKGAQANAYQPITDWSLPAFPEHIPGNVVVRPSLPSSLGTPGNERPDFAEQLGPLDLSRKGAAQNVQVGTSTRGPGSSPPPLIPSSSNVSGSQPPAQMSSSGASSSKGAQAGANIGKEEEKLIEALLYTLNLTNYTNDGVYTNFFAKDGKIVSLLHDNVDRKEYLQKVKDEMKEEYCEDEEEARELYDLREFPFEFLPDPDYEKNQNDYESKKTVVANISSNALSNLKILFSQKFGKNVGAINIDWVKKVEKCEKDVWVDRQLSNGDSLEEACKDCFPDKKAMKIIPIALEGNEYVLDRTRDTCEVELLFKEQLRRFRGTSVAEKGKSSDEPLTEEEKELFEALLYAFNYSNHNFDCPDTNFTVKNGKIASLIGDSVNVKEYLQEVRDKTKEEYCKNKKEAYGFTDFPFEFLSNCEKNQETTVVANISRSALLNLKKLFIYGYGERGDINTKTVEEAVKSKKDGLVDFKLKGGEREGGYPLRITPDEAVTESYPDKSALERLSIEKYGAGYCLNRGYKSWETQEYAQGRPKAKRKKEKMMKPDNKDSGISSGEATDAENVSSKAEGETSGTSGYESMDCEGPPPVPQQTSPESDGENTRKGSPKRTLEELSMENLTISTDLNATKTEQHSPKKIKHWC